jgi:hypothetical protein
LLFVFLLCVTGCRRSDNKYPLGVRFAGFAVMRTTETPIELERRCQDMQRVVEGHSAEDVADNFGVNPIRDLEWRQSAEMWLENMPAYAAGLMPVVSL